MMIFILLCLTAAMAVLLRLCVIDLRLRLLPDVWVACFGTLGIVFHTILGFLILSPLSLILGLGIGSGFLYVIRWIANRIYKQDTLGLGDVKLLGAAGLWLGPHYILLAITLGALAGLAHGFALAVIVRVKSKQWPALKHFSLPAGPGFIIGIISAFMYMAIENSFWPLMLRP
ncbi:MAG: A24 family peptidase [Alphaproteobacteria bacterium]|nr:A24 family peptidase [Alphaproteobacteria bacterium]